MRLIDVDAMEKLMSDTVQGDIRGYPYSDTQWEMAFKWLDHQPTIDATPVVRCRECEHWTKQTDNPGPDGLGACNFLKANLVTSEGFCYWGQRREDGDA